MYMIRHYYITYQLKVIFSSVKINILQDNINIFSLPKNLNKLTYARCNKICITLKIFSVS